MIPDKKKILLEYDSYFSFKEKDIRLKSLSSSRKEAQNEIMKGFQKIMFYANNLREKESSGVALSEKDLEDKRSIDRLNIELNDIKQKSDSIDSEIRSYLESNNILVYVRKNFEELYKLIIEDKCSREMLQNVLNSVVDFKKHKITKEASLERGEKFCKERL